MQYKRYLQPLRRGEGAGSAEEVHQVPCRALLQRRLPASALEARRAQGGVQEAVCVHDLLRRRGRQALKEVHTIIGTHSYSSRYIDRPPCFTALFTLHTNNPPQFEEAGEHAFGVGFAKGNRTLKVTLVSVQFSSGAVSIWVW